MQTIKLIQDQTQNPARTDDRFLVKHLNRKDDIYTHFYSQSSLQIYLPNYLWKYSQT